MTLTAVLFDVAGVLLIPAADPVVKALREIDVYSHPDDIERAHYAGVAAIEDVSPALADHNLGARPAYLKTFVDWIGVPAGQRPRATAALVHLWDTQPISVFSRRCRGVPEGLVAVARTGVECAIVSNSDGTVAQQLLEQRVCQVGAGPGVPVCAIIDSFFVGVSKPDPRIFELGLEAVQTRAESAVFVGDSYRIDVVGANSVGMEALHVDPFGFCDRPGHGHVSSLDDVAVWVKRRREGRKDAPSNRDSTNRKW